MDTYLVTGAAGFIGSHSVDRLLAMGYKIIGVDNFYTGNIKNLGRALRSPEFQFLELDVTNEQELTALFHSHKFAGVLHLAALVSVPESFNKPALNFKTNIAATDNIARLCIDHQCPRIVFASSAAVYGNSETLPNVETATPNPQSPYAAAKLASEILLLTYAKSYQLEAICFRYFNVYGPRQDPNSPYSGVLSIFAKNFQNGSPVTVYGDGEQTRDFIYVQDVAHANCSALTVKNINSNYYNLCTNQAISLNQVLALFHRHYPNVAPAQYGASRVGDIRHSRGDANRLQESLGISAQVPFDKGLKELLSAENI